MCDPVPQGTCVTFLFLISPASSIQTDLLRQHTPFQAKCQLLWAALYFLSPPPLYPRILSSPDEIPLCSEVLPSLHFLLSCSFIISTVTHQILRSKGGGETIPLLWEAKRAEPHTHTGVWGHLHNNMTRQRSINCFTHLLVWMSSKLLQLD